MLETGEQLPDFPKKGKTDSINHKAGELPTNLCKRLSCILNWADFRAHRKGSSEKKANNSVEKWTEDRQRQFTEEEIQVAKKYKRSPKLWKYTLKQPDAQQKLKRLLTSTTGKDAGKKALSLVEHTAFFKQQFGGID